MEKLTDTAFIDSTGDYAIVEVETEDKKIVWAVLQKTPTKVIFSDPSFRKCNKFLNILLEKEQGTYVGVRFDKKTVKQLNEFMDVNNVPNQILTSKLHSTLIYSKKPCPDFKALQDNYPLKTKFKGFELFGEDKTCLVVLIDSPEMIKRNKEITEEHGATSDYDEYHPHITLTYNVEDLDVDKLPDYPHDIIIQSEYSEPIAD